MKVLAVDYGDKNIGLAVSDMNGTVAFPHGVIKHISKRHNAERISLIASDLKVEKIIVGLPEDENGDLTFQANKVVRFIEVLKQNTTIDIETWDEYGTTNAAIESQIEMGVPRKKRTGHKDHIAATIILQSYLDSCRSKDGL